MPLREILESTFAVPKSLFRGGKGFNGCEEMPIIIHKLQLDPSQQRRIPRQGCRGFCLISTGLHEGLEAESFQPLSHGAAIPSQGCGGGLHIKGVPAKKVQDSGVACRIR